MAGANIFAKLVGAAGQGVAAYAGQQAEADAERSAIERLLRNARAWEGSAGATPGEYQFNPESWKMAQSELGKYQADPALVQAQMEALRNLRGWSQGTNDAQRGAYMRARNEAQNTASSLYQNALSRLRQSGGLGGGAEAAAASAAAQGAANQNAQMSANLADTDARMRLGALGQYGQFASGMRGQGFEEAAKKAQAQDAINQFNAMMAMRGDDFRAANRQQEYLNRMRKLQGIQGAQSVLAQADYGTGAREKSNAQFWGNYIKGLSESGGGMAGGGDMFSSIGGMFGG